MRRIESQLDVNSEAFRLNREHNQRLAAELRERERRARYERPQRDLDRLARQKKMFVRDRIEMLLDPGTPFLELSTLAANQAYDGEVPSAGQVSGIGVVSGREVILHADDASVKGGAWYPLSVKKIVRTLDIAIENRLPVIHLCDSAGGFLPLQAHFFADRYYAGRIFRNQCTLSRMGVPQVAIVLGHCTAGGAYIPALSDYSVIVRGTGAIFLGGPPLVKAATGEEVSADELGGCDLHTRISGTADYPAHSEEEAIAIARDIVARLKRPQKAAEREESEPPYYDPAELYGVIPRDNRVQFDMREVIARIVDGSRFHEYQPAYGTTLVCGYASLWGYQVGILANNGVLFNDSSLKAAHFMQLCNQNGTPMLFLPEHHWLHGRPRIRDARDYQGRGQDDHGAGRVGSSQADGHLQRIVRRGKLRDGRARIRSAPLVHVAAVTDLGDGRRAGRERAERGKVAPARTAWRDPERRAGSQNPRAGAGELSRTVQRLLLDLRAMGRRRPRPRRYLQRTGYCAVGEPQHADRRLALRRLPHVRVPGARHARARISDSPRFFHDFVAFGVNITARTQLPFAASVAP